MTMKLHHSPFSQYSRKVRITALELGVEVELCEVALGSGGGRAPEYLALNPAGKVPTLEHDGWTLWESHAIMTYLAETSAGGGALYPEDRRARADVNRWMHWCNAHFGKAAQSLTWERLVKPRFMKQEPSADIVAAADKDFARFGALLDKTLSGKSFVAGDRYSLADIALGAELMYRQPAAIDLTPFANVGAWIDRLEARDAWQKTALSM